MIAGHKKTGSIGRFFGFRELVATPVCCYVVPEGDSTDPYYSWLAGKLYIGGYRWGYMVVIADDDFATLNVLMSSKI